MTARELYSVGTPALVIADYLEENGQEKQAACLRRLAAGEYDTAINAALDQANGRRRERLLGLYQVKACMTQAILEEGAAWDAAGTVANKYGYPSKRTCCLAVYLPERGEVVWAVGTGNATKGSSPVSFAGGLRQNSKLEDFRQWAEQRIAGGKQP